MAHFAQLDENNIVITVNVVNDSDTQDAQGNEDESVGRKFCEDTWGGRWIQTSYNGNIRKNYAGIGWHYVEEGDVFLPEKTFSSWTYNDEKKDWDAPVPMPTNEIEENQKYFWDEDEQEWVLKTRPFQYKGVIAVGKTKIKKIDFINLDELDLEELRPLPSSKILPEWYKKQSSYITNDGSKKPNESIGTTSSTIKKCVPVFDAITSGYMLVTPCDIYVSEKNNEKYYEWSLNDAVQFHPIDQFIEYPNTSGFVALPKINNKWVIRTQIGTSCLFVPPMHRDNIIEILPAIVDTDSYHNNITFPFKLKDNSFQGLIPRGTPYAQIIPFTRQDWKSTFNKGNKEYYKKWSRRISTVFFDFYKNNIWFRKTYK